jgi:hypothetical protein
MLKRRDKGKVAVKVVEATDNEEGEECIGILNATSFRQPE